MRPPTRFLARSSISVVVIFLLQSAEARTQTAQAPPSSVYLVHAAQGATAARLTGQVLRDDGAIISDATVQLSSQFLDKAREAKSNAAGQFVFDDLPPGRYTLVIAITGFDSVTEQVELKPGQTLDMQPTRLVMATVNISVDALTPEQAALEQLKTEEHQRLIGVLPNFFVSYSWTAPPLTAKQKFRLATHTVLDAGNLALVGVVAGVQQATNAFPGYDQGAAGFGRRYGADLGNLVIGTYMGGAVLPSLFHQDPRYFYKGTGTKKQRFLYAVSRAVITRGDNGKNQPNYAGILGDLSAGAISNAYYPASDRQGGGVFLTNSILAIAGDAMNDVVQEFFFSRFTSDTRKKKNSTPHP